MHTCRCFIQRKANTGVQIKAHASRHVFLPWRAPVTQLEAIFNFPPTKRDNEDLITSPSDCDSAPNASTCVNDVNGKHTCTCNDGYAPTGGGKMCVAVQPKSAELFYSQQLRSRIPCPAMSKSDGTAQNISGCMCPGGYYSQWSNVSNDTLAPSLTCAMCAAGTWSYAGSTHCSPCWPGSWSLPGAHHPYMCLCDAGTYFDHHDNGQTDVTELRQCTVDVTTCDPDLGACSVTNQTAYGTVCEEEGMAACVRAIRGTRDRPCVRCPDNAVADVGAISVFECKCREVSDQTRILHMYGMCICLHAHVLRRRETNFACTLALAYRCLRYMFWHIHAYIMLRSTHTKP
jgi:hypothetical protein